MAESNPQTSFPSSGDRDWEDRILLRSLAEGQDHAFDLLVARYGARVNSYIYHLVRDAAWAEDLTQEVFLKVFRKVDSHDRNHSFAVWLFSIARNEALSFLRKRSVQSRAQAVLKLARKLRSSLALTPRSPLAELERDELMKSLDAAVSKLPEPQRSVFLLREHQGMSYLEIAEIVSCTPKTVSTRLARARANLRDQLADYLDGTPHI